MIKKGVEMNPFCDYCPCFNHTISFTYAGYVNELKHPLLFNGVSPFQETKKITKRVKTKPLQSFISRANHNIFVFSLEIP